MNAYLKAVKADQRAATRGIRLKWTKDVVGNSVRWTAPFRGLLVKVYEPAAGVTFKDTFSVYVGSQHYSNEKSLKAAKEKAREAAGYYAGISSNMTGRMATENERAKALEQSRNPKRNISAATIAVAGFAAGAVAERRYGLVKKVVGNPASGGWRKFVQHGARGTRPSWKKGVTTIEDKGAGTAAIRSPGATDRYVLFRPGQIGEGFATLAAAKAAASSEANPAKFRYLLVHTDGRVASRHRTLSAAQAAYYREAASMDSRRNNVRIIDAHGKPAKLFNPKHRNPGAPCQEPSMKRSYNPDALQEAQQLAEAIKMGVHAPVVRAQVSTMGGSHRPSVMVLISLDPRESWANGILENSRYARFAIHWPEKKIEQFVGRGFRKAAFKDATDAIQKLNRWATAQAKSNPGRAVAFAVGAAAMHVAHKTGVMKNPGGSDARVISDFLDKKASSSSKLTSTGSRLDGNWMGGSGIARWGADGKIHFADLGSKAAQSVQKAIAKAAPRNWIAADSAWALPRRKNTRRKNAYEPIEPGRFKVATAPMENPRRRRRQKIGAPSSRRRKNPQKAFNPVNYFWTWTKDWYEWDREAAIKAARRDRDAEAKRLEARGYRVRKSSSPNQLITRGGIGSGHPQIEEIVTVYRLDY